MRVPGEHRDRVRKRSELGLTCPQGTLTDSQLFGQRFRTTPAFGLDGRNLREIGLRRDGLLGELVGSRRRNDETLVGFAHLYEQQLPVGTRFVGIGLRTKRLLAKAEHLLFARDFFLAFYDDGLVFAGSAFAGSHQCFPFR